MNSYVRHFETDSVATSIVKSTDEWNKTVRKNVNSDFKLIHQNIRSVEKNLDEFNVFLHSLSCEFDCIVLTETRQLRNTNLYNMGEYVIVYNEGNINQNVMELFYI